MRVSGLAARYNNPTVIGRGGSNLRSFKEVLLKGAFRNAVAEKQDTKFLINHDVNRLMGSVASGTLRLRDTDEGLAFEADLPDSDDGRNAYASIQRGDMRECSFGFDTARGDDEWEMTDDDERGKMALRKIRNVSRLSDVSAVTYPAYSGTNVNARFENRSEIEIPKEFVVVEPETDSVEAIARRRQLLNIALL